mmetsp:Transcript_84315/g.202126  ORF Transcript_84315/g.202126 Transcript_84315/m.202126 type:complete len:410 (-) Transcript_84315:325-1554(-)
MLFVIPDKVPPHAEGELCQGDVARCYHDIGHHHLVLLLLQLGSQLFLHNPGLCVVVCFREHLRMRLPHVPQPPATPSMKNADFHQQLPCPLGHVPTGVGEVLALFGVYLQVPGLVLQHLQLVLQPHLDFTLLAPATSGHPLGRVLQPHHQDQGHSHLHLPLSSEEVQHLSSSGHTFPAELVHVLNLALPLLVKLFDRLLQVGLRLVDIGNEAEGWEVAHQCHLTLQPQPIRHQRILMLCHRFFGVHNTPPMRFLFDLQGTFDLRILHLASPGSNPFGLRLQIQLEDPLDQNLGTLGAGQALFKDGRLHPLRVLFVLEFQRLLIEVSFHLLPPLAHHLCKERKLPRMHQHRCGKQRDLLAVCCNLVTLLPQQMLVHLLGPHAGLSPNMQDVESEDHLFPDDKGQRCKLPV